VKGEWYGTLKKQAVDASAGQLALMVENGRLTSRVIEEEKLHRDLEMAAEVQRRLLPHRVPESAAATFATFSLPARSIGGDYYDFLELGDQTIGIAIADVAGKGIAAALIMSLVQASLRLTAEGAPSLGDLTARMNRFLKQSAGSSRTSYATFFCAAFEERTRRLRYINAGHNPPLVLRGGTGSIEELQTGDRVIGMFSQASYREAVVSLDPGDVLLAFTDGVTEAMNPNGEEFSIERLRALLSGLGGLDANEIAARLTRELKVWIEGAPQHDDITFIVMKVS
jgi:sigma-B regulation protein RsbU (phosphoserine phosphatase)